MCWNEQPIVGSEDRLVPDKKIVENDEKESKGVTKRIQKQVNIPVSQAWN